MLAADTRRQTPPTYGMLTNSRHGDGTVTCGIFHTAEQPLSFEQLRVRGCTLCVITFGSHIYNPSPAATAQTVNKTTWWCSPAECGLAAKWRRQRNTISREITLVS